MKKYKDMNKKLNKIFGNYGWVNQRRKLAEEQYELQEVLIEEIRYGYSKELISEIADNYVLIKQFMNECGITDEDVLEEANRKIDRQLERIKVENLLKKGE